MAGVYTSIPLVHTGAELKSHRKGLPVCPSGSCVVAGFLSDLVSLCPIVLIPLYLVEGGGLPTCSESRVSSTPPALGFPPLLRIICIESELPWVPADCFRR